MYYTFENQKSKKDCRKRPSDHNTGLEAGSV